MALLIPYSRLIKSCRKIENQKNLLLKITISNFVKMHKLTFPYVKRKYNKGKFQEIDIYNSSTKSKYKLERIYELRAKKNNRTKKKLFVKLIDVEIITWDEVNNQIAESILKKIEFNSPFKPTKKIVKEPRKGDLMMSLMKQYTGKGFQGLNTRFQLLTFQITTYPKNNNIKSRKQITFPSFNEIKGG